MGFLCREGKNVVTVEEIKDFRRIPGVWAIWGRDAGDYKICLDVHESVNIGKEMKWVRKRAIDGKRTKRYEYIYGCYTDIAFTIVALHIESQAERETIEASYASENHARYWHTAVVDIGNPQEFSACASYSKDGKNDYGRSD
jgi:hypothetical protein